MERYYVAKLGRGYNRVAIGVNMTNLSPVQNKDGRFAVKHGLSFNKWFPVWSAMMNRCYNHKNESYLRYGARGITVCKAWHNPKTFINWCEKLNPKAGFTVERVNNDKGYSPSNCIFADRKTQANNRRSTGFRFRDERGRFTR